jgi:Fe-S-cluster-containing dehydrogenase component/DMSO reductase anchor subunit
MNEPKSSRPSPPPDGATKGDLVLALLAEQRDLTAVERFAQKHESQSLRHDERRYRELLPRALPGSGQQYAFEVELERCTGCKACVTGCHSMNGLDEGEVWRTVGLLHGGSVGAPAQQTVTTACHHCVEPACMYGCPVKAYDKDPITGIVKHFDDQCIGCQYCIFMCPYDAPKYNPRRGIVRKCDMCSDRLAHGEAPACVQSCPNEAIAITVVEHAQVVEMAQSSTFLPGAPKPGDTLPTTLYQQSSKPAPRNLLPADFYALSPEHAHPALVVMLVLTQLSVGAFAIDHLLGPSSRWNALMALLLGVCAMTASLLHLGRPRYAYRAMLGLRTSWLSREILAFSVFAGLAALHALRGGLAPWVTTSGFAAVGCSIMVYAATRRPAWRAPVTAVRFLLSSLVLGTATVALTAALVGSPRQQLFALLAASMTGKLLFELAVFRHLRDRQHTELKRTALLMMGDLSGVTAWRFGCGALGGVLVPALVSVQLPQASIIGLSVVVLLSVLAGELLERHLFFAASTAPRMPGSPK